MPSSCRLNLRHRKPRPRRFRPRRRPQLPWNREDKYMAQFFITRPIVAMVISILITIAGLVSMSRLPIAQLPDIVPPQVQVSTTFTGADAVAVEQAVATSIEQQVNGADNMLYMKSTSANDSTLLL